MNAIAVEIIIIMLLLAANGLFAMTEIAVVSARKTRLRRLAELGDRKAGAALALAESPNRFLATVQAGITLIGVMAGAFGGATIAAQIAARIKVMPLIGPYGEAVGIATVILGITFLSLIIGELVPKRIGLSNPERIARAMAWPMQTLAKIASPLVRLLSASTELVLKCIPLHKPQDPPVTEDDIKLLVQEGVRSGVFDHREPKMVEGVLSLDRLPVGDIMTLRGKITWLDQTDSHDAVWRKIVVSGHSCYPVYDSTHHEVAGVVSVKSIYAHLAAGIAPKLADLLVPVPLVSTKETTAGLLETLKRHHQCLALVTNDAGEIVGLVTLSDVMEAIVGEFPGAGARSRPETPRRSEPSTLADEELKVFRQTETANR